MKKENDTQKYALAVVAAVVLAAILIMGLDALGFATKVEGTSSLTVTSAVSITINPDTASLGSLGQGASNKTSGWPEKFNLTNDGNVKVNVTINATNLFSTVVNPSSNYQFAVNTSSQGACYDPESTTTFTNMPASNAPALFLVKFNFTDSCDVARVEIAATVPANEPVGYKTSTVSFIASEA